MKKFNVFFDEFSCYQDNDSLKEILRDAKGVPNATYLVMNGGVFVFKKLVVLAEKHFVDNPDIPLLDVLDELVKESVVSEREALVKWDVIPLPYEALMIDGKIRIHHAVFNAFLPTIYENKEEAILAFEGILKGEIQPGKGDFSYQGQEMVLCEPLSIHDLPPRPVVSKISEQDDHYYYQALANTVFHPGFGPISEAEFNEAYLLEKDWRLAVRSIDISMQDKESELSRLFDRLPVRRLEDPTYVIPDDEESNLVAIYPELSALSEASIHKIYEDYKDGMMHHYADECRDVDFLYYVISRIADINEKEESLIDMGRSVAISRFSGNSLEKSVKFAYAVYHYNNDLINIVSWYKRVMSFIGDNKDKDTISGNPIVTTRDVMRMGRKFNAKTVFATQDMDDFSAKKDPE